MLASGATVFRSGRCLGRCWKNPKQKVKLFGGNGWGTGNGVGRRGVLTKAHAFGPREVCFFSFLIVFEIWFGKASCWSIWMCGVEVVYRSLRSECGFADFEAILV